VRFQIWDLAMSTPYGTRVTCRRCGHEQAFIGWSSIDVQIDPELKQRLSERQLMVSVCAACGDPTPVAYDALYHDMDRSLMVWPRQAASLDAAEGFAGMVDALVPDGYTARIVRAEETLLGEVRLFDEGLDDLAIETAKVLYGAAHGVDPGDPLYYQRTTRSLLGRKRLILARSGPEAAEVQITVRPQFAQAQALAAQLREPRNAGGSWLEVDRRYVARRLEAKGIDHSPGGR
jgi:hypothetical protein